MKKIFALVALVALSACTDPDATTRALSQSGFTDIKVEGYAWWGCGKDDTFATRFTATSPNGSVAKGQVCSGWLKGSTIRLD